MRVVCAILVMAFLSGCAFIEDQISVDYHPPANLEVTQGANNVTVAITAEDSRGINRDRVGSKKNGYGADMAKITATNDVVELVRGAVEHELESLGFKVGPSALTVKVEVESFYNDFKTGFFSGDAVAEVSFNLTVTDPDGKFIYFRTYKGVGKNPNIQMASGDNAKPALEAALTNAMAQFVQDEQMQKALVAAGQTVAIRPASAGKPQS